MRSFYEGYKAFVSQMGANQGAMMGGAYVENVGNAINDLEKAISRLKFNKDGSMRPPYKKRALTNRETRL